MTDSPSAPARCGPHARLAQNEHVALSQCPCGTYHITFLRKGLSLQLGGEELRAVADSFGVALRIAEAEERGRLLPSGTGSSIN